MTWVRGACAAMIAMASLAGPARAQERPLTIVAMGTSLTARGGWQEPLRDALAGCTVREVAIHNVARSGETSLWGLSNVESAIAHRPDVVLIEFAVNDASLHRWIGLEDSVGAMRTIIERLRAREPKPRVIVMGMSPVLGLRGMLRPRLPRFVAAHRDLAAELGVEFVDHEPNWRALPSAVLSRAIPDGTHPDPAMAARIMVPTLLPLLGGSRCEPQARMMKGGL